MLKIGMMKRSGGNIDDVEAGIEHLEDLKKGRHDINKKIEQVRQVRSKNEAQKAVPGCARRIY